MSSILIVDEENAFCEDMKATLGAEGYKAECAHTPEEALSYLNENRPDLVLVDVRISDFGGVELLPQLKALNPAVFVIVVTALDDYRVADLLYEIGADGYLTKPLRLDLLARTLGRLLRNRPAVCSWS